MDRDTKTYYRYCSKYGKDTSITIEFLVGESNEPLDKTDYAKNGILKCGCRDRNHYSCPMNECPIWKSVEW